jgi:hypothetical protein
MGGDDLKIVLQLLKDMILQLLNTNLYIYPRYDQSRELASPTYFDKYLVIRISTSYVVHFPGARFPGHLHIHSIILGQAIKLRFQRYFSCGRGQFGGK